MWSFPSTSQSEATNVTPLPNYSAFFRFHAIVNTAKNVFQKIKDTPFFRRLPSVYAPYEEWRSLYMNNDLSNMASSSEGGSKYSTVLYDYEFVWIRRVGPRNDFLALDSSFDSTSTYYAYQASENGLFNDESFSADGKVERGDEGNLEVSGGVPGTITVTNSARAKDAITCPRIHETQVASSEDSVSTERSHKRESDEVSDSRDDRDVHELGRDNTVREDERPIPPMSEQHKPVPTNEINSNRDFAKDCSPGSTIDTKGNTDDQNNRSGGEGGSRESQIEVRFEFVQEEEILATSSDPTRRGLSARGFLGRGWNHKRKRLPLAKVSLRGMLYRTSHRVRTFIATKVG